MMTEKKTPMLMLRNQKQRSLVADWSIPSLEHFQQITPVVQISIIYTHILHSRSITALAYMMHVDIYPILRKHTINPNSDRQDKLATGKVLCRSMFSMKKRGITIHNYFHLLTKLALSR